MAKKDILDKLAEEVDKIEEVSNKQQAVSGKPEKKEGEEKKRQKIKSGKQKAGKAKKTKKSLSKKSEKVKSELSMEELLKENPIEIPEVGDVLEGKVIEVSSNYILLDLGPLGAGIVLGKEMKDGLNAGEKLKKEDIVTATLTGMGEEDGYIELSIREASYEKAWENIEYKRDAQETIATKALDANRGGLIVEINGISSFLPVSQLSSKNYPRVEDGSKSRILEMLKDLIGQELKVKIISADRDEEKLIVSEKAVMSNEEKETVAKMKTGDIVEGEIFKNADSDAASIDQTNLDLGESVERFLTEYIASFGKELPPAGLHQRILEIVEPPLISAALTATRGNQFKAAELLGINRNTLRKKITSYDLQVVKISKN